MNKWQLKHLKNSPSRIFWIFLVCIIVGCSIVSLNFYSSQYAKISTQFGFYYNLETGLIRNDFPKVPPSLSRYIRWHASKMLCLKKESCTHSPKILLWSCPSRKTEQCHGLGDRLRGIQVAFITALVTNRLFLIDWPDAPFPSSHGIIPSLVDWSVTPNLNFSEWPIFTFERAHLIHWKKCPIEYECITNPTLQRNLTSHKINVNFDTRSNLSSYLNKFGHLIIESRINYTIEFAVSQSGNAFLDELKNGFVSDIQFLRYIMQSLFQPSPEVQERLKLIVPKKYGKTYDGMHLRTGHDIGEGNVKRFWHFQLDPEILARSYLSV